MTKDEMLKVLKDSFKDFKFYEDGHYYECEGERVGISVTRLIEEYANEFNQQEVAEKVLEKNLKKYNEAKEMLKNYRPADKWCDDSILEEIDKNLKLPITIEDILAEWKYKADFACEKGTTCHEYIQCLWSGKTWKTLLFDNSEEYKKAVSKIMYQANDFCKDYINRLEHLIDELPIGSEEYDIASCVDHLFYNKLTGGLVLVDYKTNSILKGYNDSEYNRRYTKKMKVPLQHLDDNAITHYYIQLSIYKFLIEKYTGLKVDEMFIVYMSENIENYEIIEIPYLYKEVEEILENRRIKNMNGMGVLLMGASGSGKSTSLRNLPAEETAIINITNKPMPFRNKDNKTIVTLENFKKEGEKELSYEELYKRIIATIKGTKKKIIVIDDSSYMMAFENFEKATNKGYDKFTNMAKNYYDLIKSAISCGDEKIVYVVTHEEVDDVNQLYRPKTIGKMLSNQLVIEGLFSIVLRSIYKNGEYIFQTQNDGTSVCKSPMEMFETKEIPNDLFEVDKIVREYYGFEPINKKEEIEK